MPRKRPIHRHRRWTDLQLMQLTWPLLGTGIKAFASEEERRLCWEQSRERLLAKVAETSPATRPTGWWDYESPEPRDHDVFEPVQLIAMGVLGPHELEAARHAIERWATAPGRDPVAAARAMAARPGPRRD